MTILWRPNMAIDNGLIDHDHQVLLSIINDFLEVSPSVGGKAELQRTLVRLYHYTAIHLAREEQLQAAVRYPHSKPHHQQHIELTQRLDVITRNVAALDDSVIEALQTDTDTSDVAFIDSEAAASFLTAHDKTKILLRSWLVDHILKSDLPMKPFVEKMRPYAEHMPSLWKAEAATMSLKLDPLRSTSGAFHAANAWRPAGFRKELDTTVKQPLSHPARVHENAVIARMRAEAEALGMPLDIDPTCRDIQDQSLQEALTIWRTIRQAGTAPVQLERLNGPLARFKESSVLFERTRARPFRFAVRRAGDRFCRMFGAMAGKFLDKAVDSDRLPRWLVLLNGVLDYGAPMRIKVLSRAFGRDDLVVEAILAPFHDPDKDIWEVLAVVSYEAGMSGTSMDGAAPSEREFPVPAAAGL